MATEVRGLPPEIRQWIYSIKGKPQTPEEYDARVQDMLARCEAANIVPTKPLLALALDIVLDSIDVWPLKAEESEEEKERWSSSRKKALSYLESDTMQRAVGHSSIGAIFAAKASFGLRDQGASNSDSSPVSVNVAIALAPPGQAAIPAQKEGLILQLGNGRVINSVINKDDAQEMAD